MIRLKIFFLIIGFVFIGLTWNCGFKELIRVQISPESSPGILSDLNEATRKTSPFLKLHMKSGNLFILSNWKSDTTLQIISGVGKLYDRNREVIQTDSFLVGIDSIAILETNKIENSPANGALVIFTGITGAIAALCASNPKACFGSCPTFYIKNEGRWSLRAEGFSSSIAPSLEAEDIDALNHELNQQEWLDIVVKNEALETHVIRYANLLLIPKEKSNRVYYSTDGRFREVYETIKFESANGPEGDIGTLMDSLDYKERISRADSTYLATKETLDVIFDPVLSQDDNFGVIIGCRQALLSTYLLYQTFAYMGSQTGYWLAKLETGEIDYSKNKITDLLGGIEIYIKDAKGKWIKSGEISEQGPIATDLHYIPLDNVLRNSDSLHIKIKMTKGNWRINYIGLAKSKPARTPVMLQPVEVIDLVSGRKDEKVLKKLRNKDKQLINFPGDQYLLRYKIPDNKNSYEVMMSTKGYYLEWIRQSWIDEENPEYLYEIFLHPKKALRRLAPEFYKVEPTLEETFWRSKYANP